MWRREKIAHNLKIGCNAIFDIQWNFREHEKRQEDQNNSHHYGKKILHYLRKEGATFIDVKKQTSLLMYGNKQYNTIYFTFKKRKHHPNGSKTQFADWFSPGLAKVKIFRSLKIRSLSTKQMFTIFCAVSSLFFRKNAFKCLKWSFWSSTWNKLEI